MPALGLNFDARTVDPASAGASGLPVGDHPVIIESSEVKPTKEQDGGYLQLNLRAIDGPAKGLTGVWRLNLYNSSPKAVEIAYKQLSAICHCVGVYQVNDSSALHNKPFIAVVGPQSDPKYTEVKGCKDINGNDPKQAGQGPQQGAPTGIPTGAAPQQQWGAAQQQAAPQGWAQPQQQPPQQQAPQGWQQGPAQGAAPAAGWAPPGGQQQPPQQQPAAPAQQWTPGAAPGGAPAWAQPR